MNGRAAFAPDAIAFIESLPDNGELSIKTTRSTDGKVKEGVSILALYQRSEVKLQKPVIGTRDQWTNQ